MTLGMDFLAKAGTTITMGNTTVEITKHNEAQGPMSTHRSEQPSQPTNSKLARQATNDNAEKADIENMVRFDQPEPVQPKREDLKSRGIIKNDKREQKPETVIMATIPTTGSEHVSNNTKKATIDRGTDAPIGAKGASITMGKTSERPPEVGNPRKVPSTTTSVASNAASTRPVISRPKYATPEKVINATVTLARAFEKVQDITMRGDTTITMTASRKTSKNTKDKEYQNYKGKEGKDNGNSSKINIISRRPNFRHRPKQGQFNKLATPSPTSLIPVNAFYVTAPKTEHRDRASKQAHIWHNKTDKWLPLDEDDTTTTLL
uniref:Uncharacterized protein n=1 Tax=Glossina austeni TaxID=7395 RepID=A0A1A9VVD1_GLOAU